MRQIKKTRYGDYERVLRFPVFAGYQVHIIFTEDIGESRRKRYGSRGGSDGAGALHSSAEGGHSHLFYRVGVGNCNAGTIAHEAWHAVRAMLVDFSGVTIMENEVTAYHIGYLVQAVVNFQIDLMSQLVGVKSSTKKKATHGNKDSQRAVVGMQSMPAYGRRTGTQKAGEEGTATTSQADGCGDLGDRGEATGIVRVGRA
jgi:hypothetical protein